MESTTPCLIGWLGLWGWSWRMQILLTLRCPCQQCILLSQNDDYPHHHYHRCRRHHCRRCHCRRHHHHHHRRAIIDQVITLQSKPASQAKHGSSVVVPALALWYELPSDGWPHLTSWLATAKEIYMAGFESLREPFEVKLREDTGGMAKLIVTKGVGRASIILFGILYTYLEFAADLTAEEMKDFCRPMGFVWGGDNLGSPPVNNLQNTWPCRQRFLVSSICHPIITQLFLGDNLGPTLLILASSVWGGDNLEPRKLSIRVVDAVTFWRAPGGWSSYCNHRPWAHLPTRKCH